MKERKKEALAVCCNIHAIEIGLLLNGLLCNLVCTGVKNLPPFLPFSSLSLTFPESLDFFFFFTARPQLPFPVAHRSGSASVNTLSVVRANTAQAETLTVLSFDFTSSNGTPCADPTAFILKYEATRFSQTTLSAYQT